MVTFLSVRESQKLNMGGEYLFFTIYRSFFGGLLKKSANFGTLLEIFQLFGALKKNRRYIFQLLEELKKTERHSFCYLEH